MTRQGGSRCSGTSERGAALMVAVMATAVLGLLVAAALVDTSVERGVAAVHRDRQATRYLLDAALERAMAELAGMADWTPALNGTLRSRFVDGPPGGVRRPWANGSIASWDVVDLDRVVSVSSCGHTTTCAADEIARVTTARPWGANNPRWQLFLYGTDTSLLGSAVPSPLVREAGTTYLVVLIGDDASEMDGDPAVDAAPGHEGHETVELEGHAFGARGLHLAARLTAARGVQPADYGAGLVRGVRVVTKREVRNLG